MRERILEGFKKISFTEGIHAATVDELSSRTGISKRTFYRYFKSKDEMVNAVVDELLAQTEQRINIVLNSSGNPVEKIIEIIKMVAQNSKIVGPATMRDLQKHYPLVWDRIEAFRKKRILLFIEKLITADKESYFRDIDPGIFTAALLASVREVVNPGYIIDNNLTLDKTVFSLFNIFLYGIVSDRAREENTKKLISVPSD